MATNIELQHEINKLREELARSREELDQSREELDQSRDGAAREATRAAELEAQLNRQAQQDAVREDTKMVRLKAPTGSVVSVDEETAKGLSGWARIK